MTEPRLAGALSCRDALLSLRRGRRCLFGWRRRFRDWRALAGGCGWRARRGLTVAGVERPNNDAKEQDDRDRDTGHGGNALIMRFRLVLEARIIRKGQRTLL